MVPPNLQLNESNHAQRLQNVFHAQLMLSMKIKLIDIKINQDQLRLIGLSHQI